METPLTVFAEMRAKPEKAQELAGLAKGLVEPTRKEQGCRQYVLHVDNDDPGHFLFYETWESMAHLQAHLKTPHMTAFAERSAEILKEPVRIVFASKVG